MKPPKGQPARRRLFPPAGILTTLILACAAAARAAGDGAAPGGGVEFFEARIRPVLAERCYSCHGAGAKKVKAHLLLDTRDAVLKGGDNGPAVVPGEPDESLLIKAIRYEDKDLRMPPKEPLSKQQVADFERWVKMGVPDPRGGTAAPAADPARRWALQPIRAPRPPAVRDPAWPADAIDRFILAKLEDQGLRPSPPAGKLELLRRVTFDLTGLPTTTKEVEDFQADPAPDAYERVVDRLLASPRYGERWGRHWLDVARFGESNGYEQNHLRDRAWPYRDYVIHAFNDDKPYTRFVEEQLAGDVVGAGDPDAEAATGFLVAGVHDTVGNGAEAARRQQRADDLDDTVATVGATFLGLTVGCAKCHDHKFDPIPQADYYALSAVFAGMRHEERPLPRAGSERRQVEEVAGRLRAVEAEIKELEGQDRSAAGADGAKTPSKAARPAVNPRRNVEDFTPVAARSVRFKVLATRDNAEPCLDELEVYGPGGRENLALAAAGAKAEASSLLPGYAIHQVSHLNDGRYGNDHSWVGRERGAGWVRIELPRETPVARVVWGRDNGDPPRYEDRLASRYEVEVSADGKAWVTVATGDDREGTPGTGPAAAPDQAGRLAVLRGELESLKEPAASPAPVNAYVGRFTTADPVYLLTRGDVMRRGPAVDPAALSRIPNFPGDLKLSPSSPESARRVALARWICDERNPLTARVMVNRVWQYHFGRGLVGTPSDFGANGEQPSHPELLDWLANDFVNGGWRLKRLHRQIVLSRTYGQTGRQTPSLGPGMKADAGNRLLWRMPRRLEAEAVRDSILCASGKLDLSPAAVGGPGFRLFGYKVVNIALYGPLPDPGPETWRRAVYQQTARSIHDDLMAAFDEPENAQRSPRREVSTNPLQALTLMNSPFVLRQADLFAARVRAEAGEDTGPQVTRAFRLAFGRPPESGEQDAAVELVRRHGLAALCRGLFNTNEFLTY